MKKILVYGDSNTWGDDFVNRRRIPKDKQWPVILQKELKEKFEIFQEGLPGRVAGEIEKDKPYKCGKITFLSTFRTCSPVDYVIIALGTNDLQIKYDEKASNIIKSLLWYKNILEEEFSDDDNKNKYFNNALPKIIYILPINFDYKNKAKLCFDKKSEYKRNKIYDYFNKNNLSFIGFSDYELLDDGIHLNYDGHKKMANRVKEVLENE